MFNCNCGNGCTLFTVIAAVVVGIIAAFLRITSTVAFTAAFLWVALGIAVVYLAAILFASLIGKCGCGIGGCREPLILLLVGILGSILTSVILLGVPFTAASVTGAVITGLLLAFSSVIFTSSACLISCILTENE